MKKDLLTITVIGLGLMAACNSNKKTEDNSTEIHQGYSETADQYEVDGWVISNVDVKAKLWNPRGKTEEQIEARARFLTEAYDIQRTEAQIKRANEAQARYADAIVVNSLMAGSVGIIGTGPEHYKKGINRNKDADMTLTSCTAYAFPGDGDDNDVLGRIEASKAVLNRMGIKVAMNVDDILEAKKNDEMVVIFNSQGAEYFIDNEEIMSKVKAAGLHISNFVYNNDNALAGGSAKQESGVTALGEKFIKACNENGIVVDVSHSSDQTAIDAARISTKPIIASHSPAKALNKINRNISDEAMLAIAETNGCVCATGVGLFLNEEYDANPEEYAKHVNYTANLIGKNRTCFSTDYMYNAEGMFRSNVTNVDVYPPEKGFGGPASNTAPEHIWDVAAILEDDYGWTEKEIRGFLGENLLRVYKANWSN
ncbi:dipeptidase [Algibacter mikhailovii]|uniref:dipeptidase n=1 Tax=Algibacter mikhailovii TaxID=425498 RepID=UPI00249412F9|nr:membrane dipeptidase [Algibacter mikhailovii]